MAGEEKQPRFLFPDMISFSLDPEVLTFLWSMCANKADSIDYKTFLPPARLLHIFVPYQDSSSGFVTFVRCTVVTGFITACVGLSSYATFKCLQRLKSFTSTTTSFSVSSWRASSHPALHSFLVSDPHVKLKKIVDDAMNYFVKKGRPVGGESRSEFQLVLAQTEPSEKGDAAGVEVPECNGAKKPSHLLLPGSKPICPLDRINADYLASSTPSPSPSDAGMVTGEEHFAQVHGKYFGPVETPECQEESGVYSTELVPSPRKDQYL